MKFTIPGILALLAFAAGTAAQASDNYVKVGDMLLDRAELSTRGADGMTYYSGKPWTNGNIPVEFAGTISTANRTAFMNACNSWTTITGNKVRCLLHTTEASYLNITNTAGACWSGVGENLSGLRTMNLGNACFTSTYTLLHEIGHAIGLIHEHQRPDRDSYINVNYGNIVSGQANQFDIIATANQRTGYDFLSVMHYSKTAFTSNGLNTMEPKPAYSSYLNTMGTVTSISNSDRDSVNALYTTGVDTVSISAPANGSSVANGLLVNFNASATALSGASISRLEFYDGATKIAEDATSPYTFLTSTLATGTHSLTVKAYDQAGLPKTSAAVSLTVTANTALDQQIIDGFYTYLPGCITADKVTSWRNWLNNGGTTANFNATLVSASTPSTIASCLDWSTVTNRENGVNYHYNRYLPGCITPSTKAYWTSWFNNTGAMAADFVYTMQANAQTCSRR
ncbi:MAG: M12 family metallopeptidase [Bdellovibrionota bacterium]